MTVWRLDGRWWVGFRQSELYIQTARAQIVLSEAVTGVKRGNILSSKVSIEVAVLLSI